LITKWEQKSLTLAVTGDVRIVRLWDAETELKKQDIPTGADCCTTCIDFDDTGEQLRKQRNVFLYCHILHRSYIIIHAFFILFYKSKLIVKFLL